MSAPSWLNETVFSVRCPRCSNLSGVRICCDIPNLLRVVTNFFGAVLAIGFAGLDGQSGLVLVRKCLDCGIYFQDRKIWSGAGRCIECGYNLTGNVSGRCPECGRVIAESR